MPIRANFGVHRSTWRAAAERIAVASGAVLVRGAPGAPVPRAVASVDGAGTHSSGLVERGRPCARGRDLFGVEEPASAKFLDAGTMGPTDQCLATDGEFAGEVDEWGHEPHDSTVLPKSMTSTRIDDPEGHARSAAVVHR